MRRPFWLPPEPRGYWGWRSSHDGPVAAPRGRIPAPTHLRIVDDSLDARRAPAAARHRPPLDERPPRGRTRLTARGRVVLAALREKGRCGVRFDGSTGC